MGNKKLEASSFGTKGYGETSKVIARLYTLKPYIFGGCHAILSAHWQISTALIIGRTNNWQGEQGRTICSNHFNFHQATVYSETQVRRSRVRYCIALIFCSFIDLSGGTKSKTVLKSSRMSCRTVVTSAFEFPVSTHILYS